ncbi:MAG TPA: signal recognition particle-docking protein FtsY [Candidatus Polarisedimenticolaceae bacterium]|nr:signal recognition particle-docking protein FtsY [Candidatus Polarisedimenticolaceae bacterium]
MALSGLKKLFSGLARTREGIVETLQSLVRERPLDASALDDLEAALLAADLGPTLTSEVLESVRARARREGLDASGLREAVKEALRQALPEPPPTPAAPAATPHVVLVVGVNGGGKTTTVGKLAARERAGGGSVLVAAADTFRAAAIDQLQRWTERAGVELVRQREGADPSAVVFDALRTARTRGIGHVLVDTAGRLHTKTNLMAELEKVARVAAREVPGAPHEVLLVVDATTGQNGLQQAREFTKAAKVTGIVLTKLDGTAKGGVALGIQRQLGVPVRYVGVGEGVDDLLDFDREAFLAGLLGEDAA